LLLLQLRLLLLRLLPSLHFLPLLLLSLLLSQMLVVLVLYHLLLQRSSRLR
jgi:hypothetical protein